MLVRFFFHTILHQVYVLMQSTADLQWHRTSPDGRSTRLLSLHMWARQAPEQGDPATECGLVPVQEAMFITFLTEVPLQKALQIDPHLVRYVQRLAQTSPGGPRCTQGG